MAAEVSMGVETVTSAVPPLQFFMPGLPEVHRALVELGIDDNMFSEARHWLTQVLSSPEQRGSSDPADADGALGSLSRWRHKDRIKTQAAALILCLNIGVDPPDVVKVSPCARLECWIDPDPQQASKTTESIAKTLQAQYERWQPRAKYKAHADPTVEDVKRLCSQARRTARHERVLFHYNGHGVPRPTSNGEIWVFNRTFTQYIPVSIFELASWVGQPAIYVLDCSHAGLIVECLKNYVKQSKGGHGAPGRPFRHGSTLLDKMAGSEAYGGGAAADPMQEVIILAACGARQLLPQDSDLCADIFTACLTTPIKVAMRWCLSRTTLWRDGITKDRIDRIPGRQTDRKTLLGELNWIFTSITDTIAWNMLPRSLFQKLFRQDLLVASLFRNFMLAERIMKACGCQPISYPRLPPMHQHPLWDAWDLTAEASLMQLPVVIQDESKFVPSSFFSEQLTAFELWLKHSGTTAKLPPQQLPIVLQVLLSQVHRLRALRLLGQFLDMGSWSVELALSVGIFPYVLKLLQTTLPNLRSSLVFIWCKILATDKACQQDLVKDNAHMYFLSILQQPIDGEVSVHTHAQAIFVLTMICDGYPTGQQRCFEAGLLQVLAEHLSTQYLHVQSYHKQRQEAEAAGAVEAPGVRAAIDMHMLLLKWCLLALGKLYGDQPVIVQQVVLLGLHVRLKEILSMSFDAEVRAASVFALGCLIGTGLHRNAAVEEDAEAQEARFQMERAVLYDLLPRSFDGSMLVRVEAAIAVARAACVPATGGLKRHSILFAHAFEAQQKRVLAAYEEHRRMVSYEAGLTTPGVAGGSTGRYSTGRASAGQGRLSVGGIVQLAESMAYFRDTHSDGQLALGGDAGASLGGANREAVRASLRTSGSNLRCLSGASQQAAAAAPAEGKYVLDRNSTTYGHGGPSICRSSLDVSREPIREDDDAKGSWLPKEQQSHPARPDGPSVQQPLSPHQEEASADLRSDGDHARPDAPNGAADSCCSTSTDGGIPSPAYAAGVGAGAAGDLVDPEGLSPRHAHAHAADDASDGSPSHSSAALNVYDSLVDCLGLLATDPAPVVAHYGRLTLQTTGHEMSQLPTAEAAHVGGSQRGGTQYAHSAALAASRSGMHPVRSPSSASVASSVASEYQAAGKRPGWTSLLRTRVSNTMQRLSHPHPAHGRPAGLAPHPAVPPSPTSPTTQSPRTSATVTAVAHAVKREHCIITPMPHMLAPSALDAAAVSPAPSTSGAHTLGRASTVSATDTAAAEEPPVKFPGSLVYKLLRQHFRRPLMGGGGRAQTAARAADTPKREWGVVDKIEPRRLTQAAAVDALRDSMRKCEAARKPRLLDAVQTLETGQPYGTSAILLHPREDAVTAVDVQGVVHVMDARPDRDHANFHINCYHVATGAAVDPRAVGASLPPGTCCSVVAAYMLNGLQSPMLMACAADGAVRVWSRHTAHGEQTLVSAWQSVDMDQSSFRTPGPTAFHWNPARHCLFSAGGSSPSTIFVWDLHHECVVNCLSQSSNDVHDDAYMTRFLTGANLGSEHDHFLLSGGSDGFVRLFDMRMAHAHKDPALRFKPHDCSLAGMAFRRSGVLATAAVTPTASELFFSDIRRGSTNHPEAQHEVFRKEEAHRTGKLSALCAHPNAPLFATGNSSQVVKIWRENGDMSSSIRAKQQMPMLRMGRTTCMSFAPFDLKLATGASDSLCSVYSMMDGGS